MTKMIKKSAIKKWEQSYTIPIPYFGLMEVTRDRMQGQYGNTENTDTAWFWGDLEKVFEGIPIKVSVGIFGQIEYFDLSNRYGMYDDDITEERYNELKELADSNRSGASVATYSGKVVIRDTSLDSESHASYYNYIVGTGKDYGGPAFGDFMSIDDAIARVGEIVEEFFPKVMEYVNQEKMASAKKSKKMSTMAKNKVISKYTTDKCQRIKDVFYDMSAKEQQALNEALENYVGGWSFTSFIDDLFNDFADIMDGVADEDYEASTKKSKSENMDKSKYSDIRKRLAKLGGFTKEEEEIEIDDDDVVEIEEEDGEKVVEIESKEEHAEEVADGEESEDDNLNECNSNKSEKTSKGMITSKKRVKMRKGEGMPADADDFKEDNQKGSGSAGSDMPEDADDNQNENDAGTGNAGSELPEDADDQQGIKESARKARIARMMRARAKSVNKSVNRPPVRKFSVTPGGQPNQESFNQRYQQSPMTRQAIDRHFDNSAEKSFNEVDMMNERIGNLMKSRRNPSSNNGVPKRIR